MGKVPYGYSLEEFTLDENGHIINCLQGCSPTEVKYKKRFSAAFPLTTCQKCSLQAQCPVIIGKHAAYLRYSAKDVRIAARRRYEKTAVFLDKYRYRAGVEATMSEYDRRTGVKKLRVRGMKAVSFAAVLKAIGVNIRRASLCLRRRKKAGFPPERPRCGTIFAYFCVKDQARSNVFRILPWLDKICPIEFLNLKIAA
jgi:hypothetical protein